MSGDEWGEGRGGFEVNTLVHIHTYARALNYPPIFTQTNPTMNVVDVTDHPSTRAHYRELILLTANADGCVEEGDYTVRLFKGCDELQLDLSQTRIRQSTQLIRFNRLLKLDHSLRGEGEGQAQGEDEGQGQGQVQVQG